MVRQREPSQADLGALQLGLLLGLTPLIWAHSRTGFSDWDLNESGSVTISDILIYGGRFLSAGWVWLRAAMPGPFEFLELPPYGEPTILTSIMGGALLLLAAFGMAMVGAFILTFLAAVLDDFAGRRGQASAD